MAAVLKKRVLVEYSQVIQEEPSEPPVKKLRLVHHAPSPDVDLQFLSSGNSREVLQNLLVFQTTLPLDTSSVIIVVPQLLDHLHKEKDSSVRGVVISLISDLIKTPSYNAEPVLDELILLAKSEGSHKVHAQMLLLLQSTSTALCLHGPTKQRIISLAKQLLKDTSHSVRSCCLQVIGSLSTQDEAPMSATAESQRDSRLLLQQMLAQYGDDPDPRVRTSALEAMLSLHQRGIVLEQDLYESAVKALNDDYETVRLTAVKLLFVLSHLYPDSIVPVPESDQQLRLVDDGFAKICNMVNDISVKVRTIAAGLLGSLHQVSPKFLEQTLDKKLMSNMRRKTTSTERARQHFMSGEWSTGQKWADDAPKEELDPDNVSLMSIGACGAFVHGLEDEFLEVRNASLDSLCELAAQSPVFAKLSQDCFIDMFNDEIESVRLNAINSLRKIGPHIIIREDQLEIILGVLKDVSMTTRDALHNMLSHMRLATKECLNTCVMELISTLKRYPQDRHSVWKCAQHLGRNHPELTLAMGPELLCLHPYFDTPEPDMDDSAYITILVLMFNAAEDCPTMLALFQDFIWRHYHYVRKSIPQLVPVITQERAVTFGSPASTSICTLSDSSSFIQNTLHRLDELSVLDLDKAVQLLKVTIRDMSRIKEIDMKQSASAECVSLFLQSQVCLTELISGSSAGLSSSVCTNTLVDNIMKLTTTLRHLFMGLGSSELASIHQTEVKALALRLRHQYSETGETALTANCNEFLTRLRELNKFLSVSEIQPDAFTSELTSSLQMYLGNSDPPPVKTQTVIKTLNSCVAQIRPCCFHLSNQIRKARVEITEPRENSDTPLKFASGLTMAVHMDVVVENVDIEKLRIKIRYPDMQSHLIIPPPGHILKLGPLRHRVVTDAIISHSLWSDCSNVELSMVLVTPPKPASLSSSKEMKNKECDNLIELCKPVQILVQPKQIKAA